MPMYRIHGTNIPWGVGMQVSHGCVRLYPEDIERLFPQVPVGTPGVFAYETVKVGRRGGAVYVESHEDIYGKTPAVFSTALNELERRGAGGDVDREKLEDGLRDSGGVPFVVSGSEDNPTRTSSACHDGAANTDRCQARDG
jgi:L,D-transpeptidase ErfK/SrfK